MTLSTAVTLSQAEQKYFNQAFDFEIQDDVHQGRKYVAIEKQKAHQTALEEKAANLGPLSATSIQLITDHAMERIRTLHEACSAINHVLTAEQDARRVDPSNPSRFALAIRTAGRRAERAIGNTPEEYRPALMVYIATIMETHKKQAV